MGSEKRGDGHDHEVQDHGIGDSRLAAPTTTMRSTECPSSDATVNIFPELASPAVCDEALDINTVHITAPTPAICSAGGLAHGNDDDGPMSVSMVLWTTPLATPPPQCKVPNLELITTTPTSCCLKSYVEAAYVLTPVLGNVAEIQNFPRITKNNLWSNLATRARRVHLHTLVDR